MSWTGEGVSVLGQVRECPGTSEGGECEGGECPGTGE